MAVETYAMACDRHQTGVVCVWESRVQRKICPALRWPACRGPMWWPESAGGPIKPPLSQDQLRPHTTSTKTQVKSTLTIKRPFLKLIFSEKNGLCQQDYRRWRYQRILLGYQSPYFQLIIEQLRIIEQLGSSNSWRSSGPFGSLKSILLFEMIIKFHLAHKTAQGVVIHRSYKPAENSHGKQLRTSENI